MRKIDISINQAKLINFEISLSDDNLPDVTATIGLFAGNKQISTFSLSTESWRDAKFELPISMIAPIKEISKEIETILIRQCSNSLGALKSGKA